MYLFFGKVWLKIKFLTFQLTGDWNKELMYIGICFPVLLPCCDIISLILLQFKRKSIWGVLC